MLKFTLKNNLINNYTQMLFYIQDKIVPTSSVITVFLTKIIFFFKQINTDQKYLQSKCLQELCIWI